MNRGVATYAVIVGQVLASLRKSNDLSQAAFADRMRTTQSVVSRVEAGVLPLAVDILALWASALRTTPPEVLATAAKAVTALEKEGVVVVYERQRRKGQMTAVTVGTLMTFLTTKENR